MALQARADAPLVVVFHGATEKDFRLPFLSGQTVTAGLPVSKLFLSDPSLYLSPDLALCWFAGNEYQPNLMGDLRSIINKVLAVTGGDRVITIGGSGGGYASLRMAMALGPKAAAVVMNPQTDPRRYLPHVVTAYSTLAWPTRGLPDGLDLCTTLGGLTAETSPTFYYLQNSQDLSHVHGHLDPFLKAKGFDGKGWLLMGEWGDGHIPPPKPVIRRTLELALAEPAPEQLLDEGFVAF